VAPGSWVDPGAEARTRWPLKSRVSTDSAAVASFDRHFLRGRSLSRARRIDIRDQTAAWKANVAHPANAIPEMFNSSCRVLPQIS
jgi:hypothetical protein